MCLIEMMERFPTEQSCYDFLEEIRWKSNPFCPHCASVHVAKKKENDRVGRWNCHDCHSSFKVTQGTLFQGTQIPLQKWFLAVELVINAKKSLSSYQLSRDLKLNQKTAWYMQQRIRSEMATENSFILKGIVEADETYVGGRPRKGNKREDDPKDAEPVESKKTPVIGLVQRGGKVLAKAVESVTSGQVLEFIIRNVDTDKSTLMTDESSLYYHVSRYIKHESVSHSEMYVDGDLHTNTLEGFWSLLKRAWYGSHHHYTRQFMPLYVAEACWKYNHRKDETPFDTFAKGCFA